MSDSGGEPVDRDRADNGADRASSVVDWSDWNTARFAPLEQLDPDLARELTLLLARTFLVAAGLSESRLADALRQCSLERGQTERGSTILRAHLPLGEGSPEYGWDGSKEDARAIIVSVAETAGRTVTVERSEVGPTGWEPEFDT